MVPRPSGKRLLFVLQGVFVSGVAMLGLLAAAGAFVFGESCLSTEALSGRLHDAEEPRASFIPAPLYLHCHHM